MVTTKKLQRKWKKEHPEQVKKYARNWYKKHRKQILAYHKKISRTTTRLFTNYKKSAKERQINFNLSFIDFCYFISSPCFYCGNLQEKFNGVDRINNNQEYIKDNCVSCCKQCNKMKLALSREDFIEKCREITEKQGELLSV